MNFTKTILSVTTNISRYGGAQKVMIDVHNGLKNHFDVKVLSLQSLKSVHPKYSINKNELIRFINPFMLNNKVLLIHSRNLLPFFICLKYLLFLNVRIIYVSHSVYSTHRRFTFFPKEVIAISSKVTENLVKYFKVPEKNIRLIYNGLKDVFDEGKAAESMSNVKVKILFPGRVNAGKRQVELVNLLRGRLDNRIEIHFAGIGVDFELLLKSCNDSQFRCLGFIENIDEIIPSYDFVMLYSHQEGLPLSLIEGTMHRKPILLNNVGGSFEIGIPGYNAVELSEDPDKLIASLNSIMDISEANYSRLASNSRLQYVKKFKYEDMIKNYVEVILKS